MPHDPLGASQANQKGRSTSELRLEAAVASSRSSESPTRSGRGRWDVTKIVTRLDPTVGDSTAANDGAAQVRAARIVPKDSVFLAVATAGITTPGRTRGTPSSSTCRSRRSCDRRIGPCRLPHRQERSDLRAARTAY